MIGKTQLIMLDEAIKAHGGSRDYDLHVRIGKWISYTRERGQGYPIIVEVVHRYDPKDVLSWHVGRCEYEGTAQERKEAIEEYLKANALPLEQYRLLITGSRKTSPAMLDMAYKTVQRAKELDWAIVVGDAEGVDSRVLDACVVLGVPFECYGITPAPRNPLGVAHYKQIEGSYYKRDEFMVERAHRTFAIWNRVSRGTKYTYDYAVSLDRPADIRKFDVVTIQTSKKRTNL